MLGRLLPPADRAWSAAMLAELDAIPDAAHRKRFGAGCVRALVLQIVALRVREWTAQPWIHGLALATGLLIALLDQGSDTRHVMWMTLLPSSAVFAWWRPAAAWRWGLLLAAGMPLLAAISDTRGPYEFDRGDVMFGVPPAILVAMLIARVRHGVSTVLIMIGAISVAATASTASAQSGRGRHDLTTADVAAFADSAFAEYLGQSSQPSLAFVVVKEDGIVFARGYGMEDAGSTRPVDPAETLFWMASLSKLITADAVMREVDHGRIALDRPAAQYLDWQLPTRRAWRPITIRDLLTHTSGLDEPFMQGTENDPAHVVPLADYLAGIHWRAGRSPGDLLRYSNHGMALVGHIVERTSETPFVDYIEREIFAPLGMNHSTFRQPVPARLERRIATAGTDIAADYLLPAPAGAMVGTATDMGRFLIAQLDTAGSHAAALRVMHASQWRAHPAVPGIGLGWFETNLGGVRALYHTGARHHFSVAWLSPSHRVGFFLVHSMRQGGPFQNLRTNIVRAFVERYVAPDMVEVTPTATLESIDGVYRPELLSTTTVERAGYLILDSPVRTTAPGTITMRAPGGLGALTAYFIGDGVFEVREGAQAGLRLGFVSNQERIAMGGTLLDPVVFTRLRWWQRGFLHGALLVAACLTIVIGAAVHGLRWMLRRYRGESSAGSPCWTIVTAAGTSLVLAALTLAGTVVTTPEISAASHMRGGMHAVLVFLSAAALLCSTLPIVALMAWRRGHERPVRGVTLSLLSLAGVLVAVLLWHYRLVGFNL